MPPNTQAAFNTINKMVIARSNLLIYPDGHEMITRSVKEAFDAICALRGIKAEMRIQIRKDCLEIGDETMDLQNSTNKEFHQMFSLYDLVEIAFSKGLCLEELSKFLSLIKIADKKAPPEKGLKSLKHLFPHIALEFVDYSGITLISKTDKAAGGKEGMPPGPKRSVPVADDFSSQPDPIYRISANGFESIPPPQGVAPLQDLRSLVEDYKKEQARFHARKSQPDPAAERSSGPSVQAGNHIEDKARDHGPSAQPPLGGIITKSEALEESPGLDLQSFVENLEKKLEQTRGPLSVDAPADEEIQNKSRLARTVLKEINPTLQNQLRSFDFEALLNRPTPEEPDWLSDDSDAKTAMKKLKEFNESNLELSPALTGFLKKMLSVSDQKPVNRPEFETLGTEKEALVQLDYLFKREAHEKYVIPEYDQLLKDISGKVNPAATLENSFPVEDHKHIFEDAYTVNAMARALISALQQESTQEEYTAYLKNVVLTSKDLLAQGELSLLSELLNLLLLHSQETPESFRPLLAQKSLETFITWGAINKIVDLLDGLRQQPYSDLFHLAKALGPEIVPAVVDLVGQKSSPSARKFLIELLTHYKQRAQVEIEHRLTRSMASIPGCLFMLIRELGLEAELAATLKPLLDHADPKVQDKALEALIRIKDDTAINILRRLIASEKKEGYEKGVDMAVRFKVAETVPYLINAVNQALFFMRDFPKKVAILRALGRMGATEAIPFLESLARKKWAISRKKLTQLKVALFQTLDGFRPNQIENLIKIGDGLSDAQIAAALRRWRKVGNGKI